MNGIARSEGRKERDRCDRVERRRLSKDRGARLYLRANDTDVVLMDSAGDKGGLWRLTIVRRRRTIE